MMVSLCAFERDKDSPLASGHPPPMQRPCSRLSLGPVRITGIASGRF